MLDCEDIFESQLNISEEYRNQTINSIYMVSMYYDYFKNTPSIDDAFKSLELNYQTFETIKQRTDQYVFCFEILNQNTDAITQCHFIKSMIGKNILQSQQVLDSIQPNKIDLKNTIQNFYQTILTNSQPNTEQCIGLPNFGYYEYDWFNTETLKPIKKRSVGIVFNKENRTFLLGSGYTIVEEEKVEKPDYLKYFMITLLFITLFLVYKFILKERINNIGYLFIFIVVCSLFYFMFNNKRESSKYEDELDEKQSQTNIILSILGIIIALFISSSSLQFKNVENKAIFAKTLIAAFIIFVIILIIPNFDKKGSAVYQNIRIRYFMMIIGALVAFNTIFLYIFERQM